MSWFSFFDVNEPIKSKVRVKRKVSPNTIKKENNSHNINLCHNDSISHLSNNVSQSVPIMSEISQDNNNHHFTDIQEELAYYKEIINQQKEEIKSLKQLPSIQKDLYEKQLQTEKHIRLQAEENCKIVIEQRNIAQIMYSNSEATLHSVQSQLSLERNVFQKELQKLLTLLQESNINSTDITKNINTLVNTISNIKDSVNIALKDWEEARNKELNHLTNLCKHIEDISEQDTVNYKQIEELLIKYNILSNQNQLQLPIQQEDNNIQTIYIQEHPKHDTPTRGIASMLLYGEED